MAAVASLVASVKNTPGLHYINPRFPLNIKLPENLECGNTIYVHGATSPDAESFNFNLKNAEQDANTFFHFNPRFGGNVVVRNSKLDEAWGDEEREGENPFVPGEPFLMAVTPTVDGYEVQVNGNFFTTYNHRDGMPLCDVTHVTMGGDVTVYGLHVLVSRMPIPLVLRIPKKIFLGDMICVKGQVPDGADRFALNLQCGADECADIMFHFNPRFGDNVLVCNNRCADSWGSEEIVDGLPMGPGDSFDLCITAAKDAYLTSINSTPLLSFGHRLDMSAACTLLVDGDVLVQDVTIKCPPVRLPPQVADITYDNFEEKTAQSFNTNDPVTLSVPGSYGLGRVVYLSGIVQDPTRFKVNMQCGEDEDAGVAFHFNPRWDDSDEGPVLVLNSLDAGDWGEEVRQPNTIPLGTEIELYITCNEEGYCVILDGDVHVSCFPHRMDVGRVTHVSVDGGINVTRLFVA